MYIFIYVCGHMSKYEEVKRQLEEAIFVLYHMGSGIQLSGSYLARTFQPLQKPSESDSSLAPLVAEYVSLPESCEVCPSGL